MICRLTVENYKAFGEKVELDFFANKNIKRFDYNHINVGKKSILKTIGFYGPNNAGKTCLLLSIIDLLSLMNNEKHVNLANVFYDNNPTTSFSVEYYINGRFYVYSLSYNNEKNIYEKEKLVLRNYNDNSSNNETIFIRNGNNLSWHGITSDFKKVNPTRLFSQSLPFMLVFDDKDNEVMLRAKKDYDDFLASVLFLRMDKPLDITKTMSLMRTDSKAAKFVKEFVKNCDLHIDDFGFDDNVVSDANIEPQLTAALNNPSFIKETLKFYSKHNGYRVPSIFFDSVGTMKLVALAGYIYDALKNGKVLIVDEIDSSLHHILTKSIVAMFNNMLNNKAQLLFTTHDVLLLDMKALLRKDQVWLVDVMNQGSSTVYRMSDKFTSRDENGIRGDEDITDYYLKGQFGSIPTPDLFSSLEEAVSDE